MTLTTARSPAIRLFLTATSLLFVELLLIRWIPANVIYVGFFRNFLLMASFLGIGLGILWGRDPRRIPISPFGPLLLALVLLVTQVQVAIHLDTSDEIFALGSSHGADTNFIILAILVIVTTVIMAGLAVPLGPLLNSMPPLRAYSLDILGSMTGIALFTVLSAAWTPPVVWFIVLAVIASALGVANGLTRISTITAGSLAGVVLVVGLSTSPNQTWSPYYKIDEYTESGVRAINVNGIPHQALWPADGPLREFYEQIYHWFPDRTYERVLIIGAGSGTDVSIALKQGAGHIDAVEIDPAIQAIGVDDHPDRPYDDPRVTRIVEDGRAFLRRTTERYDLVIFALPDSLTLVSTSANLRLESFLFTTEAFRDVRDHLADDGAVVLYNYYREPWLPQKIGGMLQEAFGSAPIMRLHGQGAATIAAGPMITALGGAAPPGDGVDPAPGISTPQPATDDWAVPLSAPTLDRVVLPRIAGDDRRAGRPAHRPCGAPQRDLDPQVQSALLRAGGRVPAPRNAQPGDVQLAFRDDVAGQRIGLLRDPRERSAGDPHQPADSFRQPSPSLPGAVRLDHAHARVVAIGAAHRAGVAALHPGSGTRVRAGVLRQPRVQLLVPRYEDRRHGVRVEPGRSRGRWRRRIHRADQRVRLPARGRRRPISRRMAPGDTLPIPRRSRPRCALRVRGADRQRRAPGARLSDDPPRGLGCPSVDTLVSHSYGDPAAGGQRLEGARP
jgi:hypothetical protein